MDSHNLMRTESGKDEYIGQFKATSRPQNIHVLSNVIYDPFYKCLFTNSGKRIDESIIHTRLHEVPKQIQPNATYPAIAEPFLYAGDLDHFHYGHFLIECTCFLWALAIVPDLRLLYFGSSWNKRRLFSPLRQTYHDEFLSLLRLNDANLCYFSSPVMLTTVHIPDRSLIFGRFVSSNHADAPEAVANHALAKSKALRPSLAPVYLSRSKLRNGFRAIRNEDKLEQELKRRNVMIAYPETMTLSEQIILFNEHTTIIGCQGSALHNILFSLRPELRVYCITASNTWLDTFYMVDFIKRTESHYLNGLVQATTRDKPEWTVDKSIRVSEVIAQLEELSAV